MMIFGSDDYVTDLVARLRNTDLIDDFARLDAADLIERLNVPAQGTLGKEIAKLMDKHGIAPAKPQFWLDLEALTSTERKTCTECGKCDPCDDDCPNHVDQEVRTSEWTQELSDDEKIDRAEAALSSIFK
jgi:hypothetical protein